MHAIHTIGIHGNTTNETISTTATLVTQLTSWVNKLTQDILEPRELPAELDGWALGVTCACAWGWGWALLLAMAWPSKNRLNATCHWTNTHSQQPHKSRDTFLSLVRAIITYCKHGSANKTSLVTLAQSGKNNPSFFCYITLYIVYVSNAVRNYSLPQTAIVLTVECAWLVLKCSRPRSQIGSP